MPIDPLPKDESINLTGPIVINPGDIEPLPTAGTFILLTAPTGGTFDAGATLTVRWGTSGPVARHEIQLSTDAGATFATVSPPLAATATTFTFALPTPLQSPATAIVRVRALDAVGTQLAKADSNPFTLRGAAPTIGPPVISGVAAGRLVRGRPSAIALRGVGLPEEASAYKLELTGAGVVSASRVPPPAVLAAAVSDARARNVTIAAALRDRHSAAERDAWNVEVLIYVPPVGAQTQAALAVTGPGGTARVNLPIGPAATERTYYTLSDGELSPEAPPTLPNAAPDASIAPLLNMTPAEAKAALDEVAATLQSALADGAIAPAAADPVPATGAAAALGVLRAKPEQAVRNGRRARITSDAVPLPAQPPPGATDLDADGLSDDLEDRLAKAFAPFFHVSNGEKAGTGYVAFDPAAATRRAITAPTRAPIVYHRVRRLGVRSVAGVRYAIAEIIYFQGWNADDGPVFTNELIVALIVALFQNLPTFLAVALTPSIAQALSAHAFDEEYSAVLVAARLNDGEADIFPTDVARYAAYEFYTAAHDTTAFDKSAYVRPPSDAPVPIQQADGARGRHIELFVSQSKHGTYHFDPNGLPLTFAAIPLQRTITTIIAQTVFATIRVIEQGPGNRPLVEFVALVVKPAIYVYVVTAALRFAFSERFQRGGFDGVPAKVIPVGELSRPRQQWINAEGVRQKFNRAVWQ